MASDCTNCGHPVPEGQFRCSRCGASQDGDEVDDGALPAEDSVGADDTGPSPLLRQSEPPADDAEASTGDSADALSLPPPSDDALELDPAPARETSEPAPEPEAAPRHDFPEEGTEKRKVVPKGAFGEGSVVDKLPSAPPGRVEVRDSRPPPQAAEPVAEASAHDTRPSVDQLPGLEPTRHRDDEDSASQPLEDASATPQPAPTRAARTAPAEAEVALDLDVPSGGLRNLPAKARPPFLASEIMREDIIPERPGVHRIARLAQACGVAAVMTYAALAPIRPDAGVWGVPALAILALGVLRLSYVQRAIALAALALGTCVAVGWLGVIPGHASSRVFLPAVLLWLSASLLLRSWYRGHRQPPWMVAGGVAAAALIAVEALAEAGPWVLHGVWQSWLPALLGFAFALLLLLSLLALMGPETSAGGVLWAVGWWGWYGVSYLIMALVERIPPPLVADVDALADAAAGSGLVIVFVLPPGALALAQLYAVALSRREPATDDPHVEAAAAE